jgi:hypothetical protein
VRIKIGEIEAEAHFLCGPGTVGLTLGYAILILRGHIGSCLLAHELRHVYQCEAVGSIAAFLPVYLWQIAMVGYEGSPLERDARGHEVEPSKRGCLKDSRS